ncbi:MAG: apolipoprotein N-acyltransferase [Chlamydiales bacterium]
MCVSFGTPAWSSILSFIASIGGYAAFWTLVIDLKSKSRKFWLGCLWYTLVQLIQLSWLDSHPYLYIYFVHFSLSFFMGAQFGVICMFIDRSILKSWISLAALGGMWVILEWSRLFILSGLSLNPSGMALAGNRYGLQLAALIGVYGMSFYVLFTNLLVLRAWYLRGIGSLIPAFCLAVFPAIFGMAHYHGHAISRSSDKTPPAKVLLVQTNFPAEEVLKFTSMQEMVVYVQKEWQHILSLVKPFLGSPLDCIVLPEAAVPFPAFYPIFKNGIVNASFETLIGEASISHLPPLKPHLAMRVSLNEGDVTMVNHAFWTQALANCFNAPVIIGMEDVDHIGDEEKFTLSAFIFYPFSDVVQRYDKRVLLPMAEYIPSEICRKIAKKYGVCGSFTCGTEAKIFHPNNIPSGVCICYEETFGNLMRENRQKGAEMLINITSDVWYPHSMLPYQHFEHARLRTVEMGIPLIRACNTGVTGAIDALGDTVSVLRNEQGDVEDIASALYVEVPRYHYRTLYSLAGDMPVLLFSFVCVGLESFLRMRKNRS